MKNELIKKLTGKNQNDYEFAAKTIVNTADVEAFSDLVEQSDFLFDFIKNNVSKRLSNAVNNANHLNLLGFLKIYSPDYEDFIITSLVKFADEDLTDTMLELLENGKIEEKTYAAKYFSYVNDTLAIDLLRKYSYDEFDALAQNSALALSAMKDEYSYNLAIEKIKSDDEFEKLSAVRFLVAFNDKRAIKVIFETMKNSTMPENIASEISYLQSFLELLDTDFRAEAILAINHVINGLGEIVSVCQVFDFQLFEVLEKLIEIQNQENSSKIAVVLLNAKQKFDQLTENDEYLYDEDKNTKNEIFEIKKLLNSKNSQFWKAQEGLIVSEIEENSDYVLFALDLVQELKLSDAFERINEVFKKTSNQTLILRCIEAINEIGLLDKINKDAVFSKLTDSNIKAVAEQLFN